MADKGWGHCQHCRYFASLAMLPLADEEARCQHPNFSQFELRVYGAFGCREFELRAGIPESAEGVWA